MFDVEEVADRLKDGQVGLLPSDTIYGLSCLALNEAAVERLHQIKKRDTNKPFIVLISKTNQLKDLGIVTTDVAPALRYWPGKLTIICEAPKAPEWLHMGTKTLAVRQPDVDELRDLIERVGPIISTSANLAGGKPAASAAEAKKYFGGKLDFYVDVGELPGEHSTIVQARFGSLKVIRQGAVKIKQKESI